MTRDRPRPTEAQIAVFAAYASTGSLKEAAHMLNLSEATARRRVSRMFRGIGAVNAVQAAWILWGPGERFLMRGQKDTH